MSITMTRITKTGSRSKQISEKHVSSQPKLSEDQNSTQSVRLDAAESAGEGVASTLSASVSQLDDQNNPPTNKSSGKKGRDKRQTVVNDDGLGKLVGEYDVYMNQSEKRLMLLQYPNRDIGQPYSDKIGLKPLELRIKPKCGLVEVDIPMILHSNFDKEKGIQYGQAMRNSRILQEGGSYGLAGGFRAGHLASRLRLSNQDHNRSSEEPSHETLLGNFEDANNKGHVMNKLTLGGRIIPWEDGNAIYFLGVFKGSE